MKKSSADSGASFPGRLVERLINRLKWQAVGDICLQFFPPLLVLLDLDFFLYRSGLVAPASLIGAGAALLGVAFFFVILRYRSSAPVPYAARLIDAKVGGKDRVLTLATIDPLDAPSFLVDRLRREVAGFLDRTDLRRDFPYRMKRSFFAWLIGSLAILLLFHLFSPTALPLPSGTPSTKELELLIQKMSKVERFSELARNLEAMTARLRQPDLSQAEKRSLVQEARNKVENQLGAGQQEGEGNSELMGETAKALRGLEQGLDKGQEQKGGSGTKTNSSEEGEGSGKELSHGSEEKKGGESTAAKNQDLRGKKSGNDETKAPEAAKNQREGDQGRGDKSEKESGKKEKKEGLVKEEREGKGTRNPGEEIPHGAPPDRFLQPGERGENGVKGGRFVAVRLPEEDRDIAEPNGESSPGKKGARYPKTPVSNVPLRPPDSPDVAGEKQYLPLEYRGLIR